MAQQEIIQPIEPAPLTPQSGESSAIISMIERAARDPSVDIDKFERLMAMKERVELSVAQRAFQEAMSAAQGEVPQVVREAENSHTRSRYATLEAIAKKLTPIITKHGFNMSFDTADSPLGGHYRLICHLGHIGGFSREYHADLPSDAVGTGGKINKTAIQAFGSTISYGRRYLTMMIFNVALANEDNDGNAIRQASPFEGAATISPDEIKIIQHLIVQTGSDIEKFCKFMGVEAIPDISAQDYGRAIMALEAKKKKG